MLPASCVSEIVGEARQSCSFHVQEWAVTRVAHSLRRIKVF